MYTGSRRNACSASGSRTPGAASASAVALAASIWPKRTSDFIYQIPCSCSALKERD